MSSKYFWTQSSNAESSSISAPSTLTHFFRGKEGDALDGYVRMANDLLFNPDGTLEQVEQMYEADLEDDGQDGLESQVGLAQFEQVSEDVHEKAETSEEREAALRKRFADSAN